MNDAPFIRDIAFTIETGNGRSTIKLHLDMRQMSQRLMVETLSRGRMYEESLVRLLTRVLRPGDAFLDIGAHVGFFTILSSYLVGDQGKVVSVEPNADNAQHLVRHIEMNARLNVERVQAVVGDKEGTVTFYRNADNDGGHALWDPGAHSYNTLSRHNPVREEHPCVTVDKLAAATGGGFRAAKIDTEGAEVLVLKGGAETFRPERTPFVVCEVNSFGLQQMGADQMTLSRMMRERGYWTFVFPEGDGIPIMVPDNTALESNYIFNVIFATPDAVGQAWPSIQPKAE